MYEQISWPGWETVRLIGRGSFGAVYEIQRNLFGVTEKAALKVITIPQNEGDVEEMRSDGYDDESITSTFQGHLKSIVGEYSTMRKMNGSSNIVNCDDVRYEQHDDGIGWDIFIKMELLTPLTKALPAAIPEELAIQVAGDMCEALELCSKHNIVHRDIKPQNIFVSPNGDYKLGDFGIAKTVEKTMGGTKTGTYKYMAPEVYSNRPYNSTADIYSLGLVLYWLLNERRMPFMPLPPEKLKAGVDEESRNRRFAGEQIPAPKNGSEELKRIVLKACAFDPKDRYQSAAEMLAELNALGVAPSPAPAGEKQPEQKQAHIATDAPILPDEEEGGTVGPVFAARQTVPSADPDDDGTVGPVFTPKTSIQSQRPVAEDDEKTVGPVAYSAKSTDKQDGPKAKKAMWGIWVAVCTVVVILVAIIWGVSDNQLTSENEDNVPANTEQVDVDVADFSDSRSIFAYGGVYSEDYSEYYAFMAIVDANNHLWLWDMETRTVYDTEYSNIKSVAIIQMNNPPANYPVLYCLDNGGCVWNASLERGEHWYISALTLCTEWTNVENIYGFGYDYDHLIVSGQDGSLYMGTEKCPLSNAVDVQCVSNTIVIRTRNGDFYGVGENKFNWYAQTSEEFIPVDAPVKLLFNNTLADMRLVRICGVQELRFAMQDTYGNVTVYGNDGSYVTASEVTIEEMISTDCSLYAFGEKGHLYCFGEYSSGVNMTAAGDSANKILCMTESERLNGVQCLFPYNIGCLAVDNDGFVYWWGQEETGLMSPENLVTEKGVAFNLHTPPDDSVQPEKAFSSDVGRYDRVYADITSIEPMTKVSDSGTPLYTDTVCVCYTTAGDELWVCIDIATYRGLFDPTAYFQQDDWWADRVEFSSPVRIYGVIENSDALVEGLSSQIGSDLVLKFEKAEGSELKADMAHIPVLEFTNLTWSGEGTPLCQCEENGANIHLPGWETFSDAEITIRNAEGERMPSDLFHLSCKYGSLFLIEPSERAEFGVYHFNFYCADGEVTLSLCYGYKEGIYKEYGDIGWYNSTFQHRMTERYLVQTETGLKTTESHADRTTFQGCENICGIEYDANGMVQPVNRGKMIKLQTIIYHIQGGADLCAFEFDGWYLAADATGNVYFTKDFGDDCYWMFVYG